MPSSACVGVHRALHSFPTRRSSDLHLFRDRLDECHVVLHDHQGMPALEREEQLRGPRRLLVGHPGHRFVEQQQPGVLHQQHADLQPRSEEHTSELQSPVHLVCRLLLASASTVLYTLSLHDALPIFTFSEIALMNAMSCSTTIRECRPLSERNSSAVRAVSSSVIPATGSSSNSSLGSCISSMPISSQDRKSTRLNSSHPSISYAVFCLRRRPPCSTLFPYTTLFRSSPFPRSP